MSISKRGQRPHGGSSKKKKRVGKSSGSGSGSSSSDGGRRESTSVATSSEPDGGSSSCRGSADPSDKRKRPSSSSRQPNRRHSKRGEGTREKMKKKKKQDGVGSGWRGRWGKSGGAYTAEDGRKTRGNGRRRSYSDSDVEEWEEDSGVIEVEMSCGWALVRAAYIRCIYKNSYPMPDTPALHTAPGTSR